MDIKENKLYSTKQAAEFLGIPRVTLKDWVYKQGRVVPGRYKSHVNVFSKQQLVMLKEGVEKVKVTVDMSHWLTTVQVRDRWAEMGYEMTTQSVFNLRKPSRSREQTLNASLVSNTLFYHVDDVAHFERFVLPIHSRSKT